LIALVAPPSRACRRVYTFWHYLRKRWQSNAGLRLDHLLLSPAIASGLKDAGVERAIRGREGASDHAPAYVIIEHPGDQKRPRAKRSRK